jgi:hypothetical protein
MPKLAIAKDFLPDYAALDKPVRHKVEEVFAKFTSAEQQGLWRDGDRAVHQPARRAGQANPHPDRGRSRGLPDSPVDQTVRARDRR